MKLDGTGRRTELADRGSTYEETLVEFASRAAINQRHFAGLVDRQNFGDLAAQASAGAKVFSELVDWSLEVSSLSVSQEAEIQKADRTPQFFGRRGPSQS